MEHSETQQRVIELGKALIKELNIEPGNDTLSRWLAHYIAELLTNLENDESDKKIQLQQQCFETILTLWQHRSSFANGRRPFENFELILRTLESLNPENPHSYYRFWQQQERDDSDSIASDIKNWTDMAVGIDNAARVWIKFAIDQAVRNALDEKTCSWIEKSVNFTPDPDEELEVIIQLAPESCAKVDSDDTKKINFKRIKQFEANLEKLDAFISFSETIRAEIISELKTLKE